MITIVRHFPFFRIYVLLDLSRKRGENMSALFAL